MSAEVVRRVRRGQDRSGQEWPKIARNGQKLLDVVGSDWMWSEVAISAHSDPDPFLPSCPLLTTTDYFQPLPTTSSHFQPCLVTCDPFQPLLMTISYHSWLFLTITKQFQTFQPLLTTSIHLWSFWAIFGYFWPFLATCDSFQPLWWPFLTTPDYFWPLQSISRLSSHF